MSDKVTICKLSDIKTMEDAKEFFTAAGFDFYDDNLVVVGGVINPDTGNVDITFGHRPEGAVSND